MRWTAVARLQAVIATAAMDETQRSASQVPVRRGGNYLDMHREFRSVPGATH